MTIQQTLLGGKSQKFPSVRAMINGGGGSGSTTSRTVALPAVAAGDLLLLLVDLGSASALSVSVPGWTMLENNAVSNLRSHSIFYKISDGTETTVTINSSVVSWWVYAAFSIKDAKAIESATTGAGSGVPNSPSLSPTWGKKKTLWVAFGGQFSTGVGRAAPSGWTNYGEGAAVVSGNDSPRQFWAFREESIATQDPPQFGGGNIGGSSPGWLSSTIAIRPK